MAVLPFPISINIKEAKDAMTEYNQKASLLFRPFEDYDNTLTKEEDLLKKIKESKDIPDSAINAQKIIVSSYKDLRTAIKTLILIETQKASAALSLAAEKMEQN